MPFTLVHAGKYSTADKLKADTLQKLSNDSEKANNARHSKQN